MQKIEKNDLVIFIRSLSKNESNAFLRHLKTFTKEDIPDKRRLFQEISDNDGFAKEKFLKKYATSKKKYSRLKFDLFQDLVVFFKEKYTRYSDTDLHNKVIDFELLLNRGLYVKAVRLFNVIKKIALEKCNFSMYCIAQKKVIEYRLFRHISPQNTLAEESDVLKHYQLLSANLDSYVHLSDEVLNIHYAFMDRRANDREKILDYLNHPLLQGIARAQSVMAKYHYYRTKSLIYLGDNNYKESKKFSMKALKFLESNASKYRDDNFHRLTCINNYLDSSLHLRETDSFHELYARMEAITEDLSKNNHLHFNAMAFQLLSTLKLNYFWITRDTVSFSEEFKDLEQSFEKYQLVLRPNFKIEIVLGFAKMHFLLGNFSEADAFCERIRGEKTNPTSLYIECINLLQIMIIVDMGNYGIIPHLVNSSKYFLKKRDRLFELERVFLNGVRKIKLYHSEGERTEILADIYKKVSVLLSTPEEMIIDKKIRLLEWLSEKAQIETGP